MKAPMNRTFPIATALALLTSTPSLARDIHHGAYGIEPGPNDVFVVDQSIPDRLPTGRAGFQQPGMASPENYRTLGDPRSEAQADAALGGRDGYSIAHLQPQVGVIGLTDAQGSGTARAALGLTADLNFARSLGQDSGRFFVGPSTGVIYSHLDSPDSNFWGSNSGNDFSRDANLLLIPLDLKLGYALTPSIRVAVRGGGNLLYRSVGNSLSLGDSTAVLGRDSGWRIFPNVGGDLEIGLTRDISLMLRPDATLTPGDDFYTGTMGLTIDLG
jgi:hypothetical protein